MTGDITFSDIGDTGKSKGLCWTGSTDGASIYYQTSATDQGNLVLNLTDDDNCYLRIAKNGAFASYFSPDGAFHGKCYGAVYNDYAEFFPRGEETEPGDIVALDLSSDDERYIKATSNSKNIAGIHSDEYAMIIGGESEEQGEDYIQKNIKKYIPVSLCGRVHCKCIGAIHKGDIIVVSDIPGIGRAKSPNENIEFTQIVGYAVDEDLDTSIRQVRIRVRG